MISINTKSLSEETLLISVSLHKSLHSVFPYIFLFFIHFFFSALFSPSNLSSSLQTLIEIGRFKCLVDSEEGIENFRAHYRIPPRVGIRYCSEGQWHEDGKVEEVVIPMIAFIEGGMKVPMGGVTRDYLRAHRLAPTQCAPNMFRILGSVDALNKKMGLGLTHHDVNWVYNLYHLKGQGYYLKSRHPKVGLIQCLPESNKGLNKDFLMLSGEWSDGLPCPTREGQPGGVLGLGCLHISPFFFFFFTPDKILFS